MSNSPGTDTGAANARSAPLKIGWATCEITPDEPVLIAGQFHARVSEGVLDPITATALVLDNGQDHAVMVSCDLVSISHVLRDTVRREVAEMIDGPDPKKIVLHGTHTHAAPEIRPPNVGSGHTSMGTGVDLSALPVMDYVHFASERIAGAVRRAWQGRSVGQVAFGRGDAVVGRNRRWVDSDGRSTMYGDTNTPDFSHIEGYEDHSVNLLATRDPEGELTGLVVNVPCPAQVDEHLFRISADYWHETRTELRRRLVEDLPVLAQCSAAGDQSPHLLFEQRAHRRMLGLKGRTEREEIGRRIADAVEETLPHLTQAYDDSPVLKHVVEDLGLPKARLTEEDVETAQEEIDGLRQAYEEQKRRIEDNPALREKPRWYRDVTRAYRRMHWFRGVIERFRQQETNPDLTTEVHVIRLGNVALATNRFELYLDHGIHIKTRSPAVQTFIVQIAGPGTYVPSRRSVAGGGYGSIPASNPVGPKGGRRLAHRTVEMIEELWESGDR
jgi:hypothetical protein